MQKPYRLCFFFAQCFLIAGWMGRSGAQDFHTIPDNDQIAKDDSLFHVIRDRSFQKKILLGIRWPNPREIRRHRPSLQDVPNSALTDSVLWLRHVLKSEFVPPDLERRLIPLRQYFGEDDVFAVRYARGNVKVQMFVGRQFFCFVSDPEHGASPNAHPGIDLGARRYLRLPRDLVPSTDSTPPFPVYIGSGVWTGCLGSRRKKTSDEPETTWYENSYCYWWKENLFIAAARWGTTYIPPDTRVHGLYIPPAMSPTQSAHPDAIKLGQTKDYVLFTRREKTPLIVLCLILSLVVGYLMYIRLAWAMKREKKLNVKDAG